MSPRPTGFGAWYDEKQGDTGDLWHRTLIDPGLLQRLGALPSGTRVLDVGCGNGYLTRRLAREGARVTGVDLSEELIDAARARERAEPLGITYTVGDAAAMDFLPDHGFDVAIANMSLMDIENGEATLREMGRVVRPGGRLVASLSHPCFDIDTRSAWSYEVVGPTSTVYRKVTGYRTPHSDEYIWDPGSRPEIRTVGYHRPLSWYAHALRAAKFVIVDLDEPAPQPGFVSRRIAREWIDDIPLHLVIEARREGDGPTDAVGSSGRGGRQMRPEASRTRTKGRSTLR
ncbi:MAG TPA: class I SAM-dependent methyltransferase [Thermoplasmata archaeon]|nr:class I SAM-dependent methyltransferase [Thermoplasmata archaeon]